MLKGVFMGNIIINRVWEMPNKWTFKMKCVQKILAKYNVGVGWMDFNSSNKITASKD